MEEKLRFMFKHDEGESMSELCHRFGISRETGYVWLRRYRLTGVDGLKEHNRAARRHWQPQMWESQLVREPMWRLNPQESSSFVVILVTLLGQSNLDVRPYCGEDPANDHLFPRRDADHTADDFQFPRRNNSTSGSAATSEADLSACSTRPQPGAPVRVTWEFWRIAQSEFRYWPAGEVDLGDLDAS